ncbi:MAG: SHOCT domain-containing protein [Candidatus Nanopelagicales bacterium]|nr:SHOCT domain-containing protein [Candidatus Nanopelagicales bacterium]
MSDNVFYSIITIFFMIIYFMLLFTVVFDLFRRDMSGWWKALWFLLLLAIPFFSLLVYVIAYGRGMATRNQEMAIAAQKQQADYIRSVADTGSATDQISKAQELLNAGAITQDEFNALKQKALS